MCKIVSSTACTEIMHLRYVTLGGKQPGLEKLILLKQKLSRSFPLGLAAGCHPDLLLHRDWNGFWWDFFVAVVWGFFTILWKGFFVKGFSCKFFIVMFSITAKPDLKVISYLLMAT